MNQAHPPQGGEARAHTHGKAHLAGDASVVVGRTGPKVEHLAVALEVERYLNQHKVPTRAAAAIG